MTATVIEKEPLGEAKANGVASRDLDEEDCAYLLKSLELDAFSSVVNAMRAQGMLTDYKQLLLDHLKSALFVSDSFYRSEMRRAAENKSLSNIAQTLNPSYDTYSQWGCEGNLPCPPAITEIPLYDKEDLEGLDVADQLLKLANSHNASIENNENAIMQLIDLPKAAFVPEKLRAILRETESMVEERMDFAPLPDITQPPMTVTKRNAARRGRKPRSNSTRTVNNEVISPDQPKPEHCKMEQDGGNADRDTVSAQAMSSLHNNKDHCMVVDGEGGMVLTRPPSGLSPPVAPPSISVPLPRSVSSLLRPSKLDKRKTASCDDQAMAEGLAGDEEKTRRRRSKPRDNASCVCARVLPFIFEAVAPGQKAKPPRGNPDRRSAKRPSPTSAPAFATTTQLVASSVAQQYPGSTASSSTRNVPLSPTTPSPVSRLHTPSNSAITSPGVLLKRTRTTSGSAEPLDAAAIYARLKQPPPTPRPYLRPSGNKLLVSASAYSNPTRPYYGNPSAMGITVRGSAPSLPDTTAPHSPPNAQPGQMGLHEYTNTQHGSLLTPAGHTHINAVTRQSYSAPKSPYALSNCPQMRLPGTAVGSLPALNGQLLGELPSDDPHPICRSSPPSPPRVHRLSDYPGYSMSCIQHMTALAQDTPLAISTVGDVVQEEAASSTTTSTSSDTLLVSTHENSPINEGVRLECDEVMIPEQRCVMGSGTVMQPAHHLNHHMVPSTVAQHGEPLSLLVGYGGPVEEDVQGHRRLMASVLHHETHDSVGLVPAAQHCIR